MIKVTSSAKEYLQPLYSEPIRGAVLFLSVLKEMERDREDTSRLSEVTRIASETVSRAYPSDTIEALKWLYSLSTSGGYYA